MASFNRCDDPAPPATAPPIDDSSEESSLDSQEIRRTRDYPSISRDNKLPSYRTATKLPPRFELNLLSDSILEALMFKP